MEKNLHWERDEATARAAIKYPFPIESTVPSCQFAGRTFKPEHWNHRVVQPSHWPQSVLTSSPEQIIGQFANGYYSQALAMVVSWGTMWRRPAAIWGDRGITTIDATLRDCARWIESSRSVAHAWATLTGQVKGQLGWSAVITSKTLHFLCRSLGFEQDPPVAIDNAVIRQRVWPAFRDSVPVSERPDNWNGNSYAAYLRYMTAVLVWADARHWTTTQMEATIFGQS